ncbi:MAG: DUF481 domain-containing protein [Woeseiaceae bacterium]|jgi:putative salt-induced outer membrane protein YdiY|nr:DUF481 domain-containing protein [Woeseiaceae bacterium]
MIVRLLAATLLFIPIVTNAAEIRLKDGSVVFGTILNLVNGEDLIVDTAHMDEVTIEWDAIESIEDTEPVVVELFNGIRISGPLFVDSEGVRIGGRDAAPLPMARVYSIEEFNQEIWDGIEAYTDIGWNIVRGNNTVTQVSFGAGVRYDGPKFETGVDVTAIVNEQLDATDTRRETLNSDYSYYFHQTWSLTGLYSFEADEQQGLQGRSLLGATVGNRIVNNRRFRMTLNAGLVVNSEDFDTTEREESLEAVVASTVRWRSAYNIDLDATLSVLPSLEQSDRVRSQFDITMSMDLWGDLDFKVTGYSRYDSEPPLGNEKTDYGTTLGLSWDWD